MTLILTKVDYVTVGVTSHGTTKILPSSDSKQPQKFTVGDHDGIVHIYGMKKGELQLLFKSLPGEKISKVALGGSLGMPKDKIFIARGNTVQGYTKKGKIFLEFDTSLIEPISSLYVLGPDLAACARDIYHRYRDCKDADSYLVGEKLLDVVLLPGKDSTVYAILACSDCAIRVLQGAKGPIVLRLPCVPTVLSLCRDGSNDCTDRLLIGTIDGRIGLLIVDGKNTLRVTWLQKKTGSEITSLDTFELQDGLDLIVGRQDGYVEVYALTIDDDSSLNLRFKHYAGESISTVVGGTVGSAEYTEVLVTTYSGRIFGLTTKPAGLLEVTQNDNALARLKTEIIQLQEKLNEEREISSINSTGLIPLILAVDTRLTLDKIDSSYLLSVELDMPMDNILLQSNVPLDLLDVDTNSAVVSLSSCDPTENNCVLATYRCQVNTNRLDIRLRTVEGDAGTLQVYVTSQIQPKCCRRIQIPICALSLHQRLHTKDQITYEGPFNELKLTGSFSVAEMHAWLGLVLTDVPERPYIVSGEAEAVLNYSSCFIDTMLKCKYRKGSATFLSENISTIMIVRNVLTKEATKRKTKLDVSCDVFEECINQVLSLILPRLKTVKDLMRKVKILDALQEWELKSNPEQNLCTEFQELLKNETALRAKAGKDGELQKKLYSVVEHLYLDWKRVRGSGRVSSATAREKLQPALDNLDFTQLVHLFTGKEMNPPSTPSTSHE